MTWIIGVLIIAGVIAASVFIKFKPNPKDKQFNRDQYRGKR